MKYDPSGRMVLRSDHDNAGCTGTPAHQAYWHYDTAAQGLGALAEEGVTQPAGRSLRRVYHYDALGRSRHVAIEHQDGLGTTVYDQRQTWDQHGRLFQTLFESSLDGSLLRLGELYQYNPRGYQYRTRDAYPGTTGVIHHEVLAMNARGQVTQESRGEAAVSLARDYDVRTDRLTRLLGGGGTVQDLRYQYDALGNVEWREDMTGPATYRETFSYDALQRLTQVTGSAGASHLNQSWAYTALGNIQSRSGLGTYTYGTRPASCNQAGERLPGPHAVSRVGTTDYCYDAAGNQVRSSDGRRIDYTPFDLPSAIRRSGAGLSAKSEFDYGPGRERIGRRDYASATDLVPQLWVHVLGSTEVEYAGSGQLHQVKRTVGGVIIKVARQSGVLVTRREWLFQDAQGSTYAVTDASGQPLGPATGQGNRMSFDPFGQRRQASGAPLSLPEQWAFDSSQTT